MEGPVLAIVPCLTIAFSTGCGSNEPEAQRPEPPHFATDAESPSGGCDIPLEACDSAIYDSIVSSRWVFPSHCAESATGTADCSVVELRADGTYAWSFVSDYLPPSDAGRFELLCGDGDSGVVVLEGTSVVPFALTADSLAFGPLSLVRGSSITTRTAERLAGLAVPDLYCNLTEAPWVRASTLLAEGDLGPIEVIYGRDGRATFKYADTCEATGGYGVHHDHLIGFMHANSCLDVPPGFAPENVAFATDRELSILDGVLVDGAATYRHPGDSASEDVLVIRSRADADTNVLVWVAISGALREGEASRMTIRLRNQGSSVVLPGEVAATLGSGDTTQAIALGAMDVAALRTGEDTETSGEFAPSTAGFALLDVSASYSASDEVTAVARRYTGEVLPR